MRRREKSHEEKSGGTGSGSCAIAKERLRRTIRNERAELPEDVMKKMQSELRDLIDRYLGEQDGKTELVLEVHKPSFTAVIPRKKEDQEEKNETPPEAGAPGR